MALGAPEGDSHFKKLGRLSRWRKTLHKWFGGFELLKAHEVLLELDYKVGVFDRSREQVRGKAVFKKNSVPYVDKDR